MAASFTTMAALLKKHYYGTAATIPDLTFSKNPVQALFKKRQWTGESAEFPLIGGHNQSTSADFATAQANAGQLKSYRWTVPTTGNKKHYTIAQLPGDLIAAMEGKEDVYLPAVTSEIDSAFKNAAHRLEIKLYGNGYGSIGRIANSALNTTVCTLTNAWDAKNFEIGMKIMLAADDDSGASRNSGATLTVTNVDIDAGTVTFGANLDTVTGAAQNDHLFPEGDRDDGASTTSRNPYGMETYNPYDRTTVGTLFGVARAEHPTRLAGRYLDGTGMRIEESVNTMLTLLGDVDQSPDTVLMSWKTWNTLQKELGSKVRYGRVDSEAGIGFKSIAFNGDAGMSDVHVLRSSACPDNRIRVLTKGDWWLLHLGKQGPIRFLDEDDNQMLRQSSADAYEIRVGGYIELLCVNPAGQGVIAI